MENALNSTYDWPELVEQPGEEQGTQQGFPTVTPEHLVPSENYLPITDIFM